MSSWCFFLYLPTIKYNYKTVNLYTYIVTKVYSFLSLYPVKHEPFFKHVMLYYTALLIKLQWTKNDNKINFCIKKEVKFNKYYLQLNKVHNLPKFCSCLFLWSTSNRVCATLKRSGVHQFFCHSLLINISTSKPNKIS